MAQTGRVIREQDCYIPKENIGFPYVMFQDETCGPEAVAHAAHQFANGKCRVASFAAARHPLQGGVIHAIVTVGIHVFSHGLRREILFCGSDMRISGGGSHILCVDDGQGNLDPAEIAAKLVYYLTKNWTDCWIFRLNENQDAWED
jgi:hypothetical protein